ncbi:probable C-mannosyltransferase DPY19L2 isoform X8 [Heterocephalus glaber]|uniref:Probable C-mannosyltransferase DPY19L2 isoform X8 n=1 Tax=Heterocephalus glaber TaxID=10181 RepID=A0AAX6SQR6_HETGA|nr:probable C-mannosyltransferase DPY19L2 isoform X8 [Heterocephalus glaber]
MVKHKKKCGEARLEPPRTPRTRAREPEGEDPGVDEAPGSLDCLAGLLAWVLAWLWEKARTLQLFWTRLDATLGLAAFVGILHWIHLTTLFETDCHFSHLSTLEREMSFRNEMGLYYSYFKTLIEAPSFLEGLWMIMNDRLTEYPLVINTVKRFHLYPEVVLAFWYRTFTGIMNLFEVETKTCWNVTRVGFPSEVESCEGFGDPAYFYVGVIFILNGLMMGLLFIYAAYLSESQLGGLITVLCYFFNHGEATRVMWAPPLRESFACPFLVLQMYILTMILRSSNNYGKHYIALCLANVAFMLPWEFAQFILFTQLIQGCAWWLGTINLKLLTSKILGVSDHICLSDIIAARILRYADFDTLIYTCAPESYFMEQVTPLRYTKTLLLPVVMVITCFIFKKTIHDVLRALSTNTYLRKKLLEHGEVKVSSFYSLLVFHALQLLAFAALAILILRLKLFLTPHICVMASLICSRPLFGWLFNRVHFENVIFGIAIMMSIQGCANLQNQWRIRGEFINLPQEELLHWIKYNTRPDAVFAGIMPTMASIKLSTLHPIVNHPHYEDADLRARTKIVYSVYSRKSAKEVRDKLIELLVNYYVLEEAWCFVRTKPGCSMLEIWDMEDPSNSANPSLCRTLLQDERPYFTTVFQNAVYRVLKVNREADHIRFV